MHNGTLSKRGIFDRIFYVSNVDTIFGGLSPLRAQNAERPPKVTCDEP